MYYLISWLLLSFQCFTLCCITGVKQLYSANGYLYIYNIVRGPLKKKMSYLKMLQIGARPTTERVDQVIEWPLYIEASCEYVEQIAVDQNRPWSPRGGELVGPPGIFLKYPKTQCHHSLWEDYEEEQTQTLLTFGVLGGGTNLELLYLKLSI